MAGHVRAIAVETGLIDEYRLRIRAVVLGAGERIFLSTAHHRADKHHRLQRRGAVAHGFEAHP
jgi:hypothetical protein